MDALIMAAHLTVASIIRNLRLWIGTCLAPFSIDHDPALTLTFWIVTIGLAALFWCVPRAPKFRKWISTTPRTLPACFNSFEDAWAAASEGVCWAVISFYESRLYSGFWKAVDWCFPGQPEDKIWKMFLVSVFPQPSTSLLQ